MGDRLGNRIAGALREAAGPDPSASDVAAARGELVGELRRRRGRRRRLGASLSAAVVAAGLGSWAIAGRSSSPSSTARSASAAPSAAAGRTQARPSCAVVVGSDRCVGAVSGSAAGTAFGAGATAPLSTAQARQSVHGSEPSGAPLQLRAGRSATLVLPAVPQGASWSVPQVGGGAPAGAAGPIVRVATVAAPTGGRRATVTVTGARPGTAELVATATCRPGGGGRCAAQQWSVEVEVSS